MKIIKIPITEQNREVYWSRNKDKKAWEKLMSECPSMTSKEFWNNEWEEFDKEEISTHWYFIVGKPESIIDELINLEIGDTNVFYPHIKENRPWDIEEMDWYDLREHANTMSDFRMTGLGLTGRYLCNRKTGIRYLFLEPGRPDVI